MFKEKLEQAYQEAEKPLRKKKVKKGKGKYDRNEPADKTRQKLKKNVKENERAEIEAGLEDFKNEPERIKDKVDVASFTQGQKAEKAEIETGTKIKESEQKKDILKDAEAGKKVLKIDKIMDDIAEKIAGVSIKKNSNLKELWEKSKTDPEKKREFLKMFKQTWKEFAVHGLLRRDKEGEQYLREESDLDGATCIGLMKMAGFDVSNVKYIHPGESLKGYWHFDTG